MTGTSMDGVDAVAVQIEGRALEMKATFLSMKSRGLGSTKPVLQTLAVSGGSQEKMESASVDVGKITTKTIEDLQLQHIDFIALHGQTIFHVPPKSIQLIDAAAVVDSFDCLVLTDPRQQDLRLGGQGAPITPLADWIMFRSDHASTAIVNLGGFCNVTILPARSTPTEVLGFDVCCCNLLLNTIARCVLDSDFDKDGTHALHGTPDEETTKRILDLLVAQRESKRSLGTTDDLDAFAAELCTEVDSEKLLASATSAIGQCITESTEGIENIYLAGGGMHNEALRNSIRHDGTTEDLGVPTQAREGMAMAILGALAQDGVSITLPQITGRQKTDGVVGWTQASP
jgi:anhydro-N-acetylmuramic acid kinase